MPRPASPSSMQVTLVELNGPLSFGDDVLLAGTIAISARLILDVIVMSRLVRCIRWTGCDRGYCADCCCLVARPLVLITVGWGCIAYRRIAAFTGSHHHAILARGMPPKGVGRICALIPTGKDPATRLQVGFSASGPGADKVTKIVSAPCLCGLRRERECHGSASGEQVFDGRSYQNSFPLLAGAAGLHHKRLRRCPQVPWSHSPRNFSIPSILILPVRRLISTRGLFNPLSR